MTREELENKIVVLLAGRATEKLVFGHLSTGAADDLVRATDIARALAARYGMDADLDHVSYDSERPGFLGPQSDAGYFKRRYSEATAERLDEAVRRITADCFERALAVLRENRDLLEERARALLGRETVTEGELARLTERLQPAA